MIVFDINEEKLFEEIPNFIDCISPFSKYLLFGPFVSDFITNNINPSNKTLFAAVFSKAILNRHIVLDLKGVHVQPELHKMLIYSGKWVYVKNREIFLDKFIYNKTAMHPKVLVHIDDPSFRLILYEFFEPVTLEKFITILKEHPLINFGLLITEGKIVELRKNAIKISKKKQLFLNKEKENYTYLNKQFINFLVKDGWKNCIKISKHRPKKNVIMIGKGTYGLFDTSISNNTYFTDQKTLQKK